MVNNRLKGRMVELGITRKELADYLGITPSTLYRKICGKTEFTASEINKISQRLCLDVEMEHRIFLD